VAASASWHEAPEHRGVLVGALVVVEGDEVLAMTAGGGVIRTRVTETSCSAAAATPWAFR